MITREEIIELCDKFGLVEIDADEDYRYWTISSSLFNKQSKGIVIILSRDPFAEVINERLYFYDQLNKDIGNKYVLKSEDHYHSYLTLNGIPYMELFNKETLELAIKRIIRNIKKTEVYEKLKEIEKDFE
jgi:Txe/YoeB family toxin of Txe-Axe toxin-antitoxin module